MGACRGWDFGQDVGDGVGSGAGAAAAALVDALGDGEGMGLGTVVGALDIAASERRTAQATRPQKAVCARGCAATVGWCIMTSALEPMTITPAAAHGATYRARHVSRERRRSLILGSVVLGGSLAPLDPPVGIRPPPLDC